MDFEKAVRDQISATMFPEIVLEGRGLTKSEFNGSLHVGETIPKGVYAVSIELDSTGSFSSYYPSLGVRYSNGYSGGSSIFPFAVQDGRVNTLGAALSSTSPSHAQASGLFFAPNDIDVKDSGYIRLAVTASSNGADESSLFDYRIVFRKLI